MSTKKNFGDVMFVVQLLLAVVLCGTQLVRAFETTQGVSLSMQIILEGFLFLHFKLALGAHEAAPSRITYQTLIVYTVYGVLTAGLIAVLLTREDYHWGPNDNQTMWVAGIGAMVIVSGVWVLGRPMTDPIPKSFLAINFKAMPQVMMAWKIASEGGAGIHGAAVLVGNISILIRITQISLMIKEAGWEKNRTWLLVSEALNEMSWLAVTGAWLYWDFFA